MRGLAALLVMLGHSAYVYTDTAHPQGLVRAAVLALRNTGHPSVILFYVLSGFVLYLAYTARAARFGVYMIRRIFRIYPALLVAIAAAVLLQLAVGDAEGVGRWTRLNWNIEFTAVDVLRHALLLGVGKSDIWLNPVIWSLAIELRFSVVFIVLALICRRSRVALFVLALASYAIGALLMERIGIRHPAQLGRTPLGALAITLFYLPGFVFGIIAADVFLKTRVALRSWLQVPICLGAVLAAKMLDSDLAWAAAFTAVIFLTCQAGIIRSSLESAPSLFLGKVSYSLYLIHLPVLLALTAALSGMAPVIVPVLVAPLISLLAAWAMYEAAERPGIAAGRVVAQWAARLGLRNQAAPSTT